jgi:hypothetical protein
MITIPAKILVNDDGKCSCQCQFAICDEEWRGCVFDLCETRQRTMSIGGHNRVLDGQYPDSTKCPGTGTYTVVIGQ